MSALLEDRVQKKLASHQQEAGKPMAKWTNQGETWWMNLNARAQWVQVVEQQGWAAPLIAQADETGVWMPCVVEMWVSQ